MTNRRKGAKSRGSLSKKTESPEKQSRRVTRRTRSSRKSESPEQPEELGSEYSVDENTEDDEGKCGYDRDRDNDDRCNAESDQYESKSVDDQRPQAKEEESGGSDGSWKVKSENGGSGGIPKLKLCLTRPPEMSSPTSEQPSPRRRRRGRGAAQALQEQQLVQEEHISEEKESPKRSTRSGQRQVTEVADSAETIIETKEIETVQSEDKEAVRSEVCDSTNINHSETEDETQMAVDSIIDAQKQDETEEIVSQGMSFQNETREAEEKAELKDKVVAPQEIARVVENEDKMKEEVKQIQNEMAEEPSSMSKKKMESAKDISENAHGISEEEPPLIEGVKETQAEKSSPSRDSSEERAKEAALKSRNRRRKLEGSEDGEVVDSPAIERSGTISRIEDTERSHVSSGEIKSDIKENQDDPVPTKASSRKRRWGASTSRVTKKPPVSISTDFLKEIIPEVKPIPMSEVQLSPNEEEEEGQVKDNEDNIPVQTKKLEREKMVQSDESEKDYEEEAVESGAEESPRNEAVKATPQIKEKEFTTFTRKVSVLPSNDLNKLQRSPSPPRNKPSNILYIVNLVRPFTIPQLRELLARTGTIAEDGFWIDKIKSRCYVKYETEDEAKTTRHALHGVRWPVSNPKQLNVDYGTEAAMKAAQEGNEILPKRPIPSLFDKAIEMKSNEMGGEREDRSRERKDKSEKDKKEQRIKHREDEKREEEDKEKKIRPPVEPLVRDRTVRRVTVPVREWDVGKNEDGFSPPPDGMEFGRHRDDRFERRVEYDRDRRDEYDERRRRDKERGRRSVSNEPPRKAKRKNEDDAPAKLLDDLFRKTKATPCIYWLPLTAEQIAVKEELRRKHMAEHEKRVAEMRKIQRDQSKRSSEKRRRRSKSKSRSRSPKK